MNACFKFRLFWNTVLIANGWAILTAVDKSGHAHLVISVLLVVAAMHRVNAFMSVSTSSIPPKAKRPSNRFTNPGRDVVVFQTLKKPVRQKTIGWSDPAARHPNIDAINETASFFNFFNEALLLNPSGYDKAENGK